MEKITLILGGARSGKSSYALKLAKSKKNAKVAFIATAMPIDNEMKERIKKHKESRPKEWTTFEDKKDISNVLLKNGKKFQIYILDCLTLHISNLIIESLTDKEIEQKIIRLLIVMKSIKSNFIIVSNEVGLGIVPANKLARNFRDIAGKVNQMIAEKADRVIFMVSGLPLTVKQSKH